MDPVLRRTELLAMALLRHEVAIDFLLSLIAAGSATAAREAVAALDMYRGDQQVWRRVKQQVETRGDVDLRQEVGGY